MHTVVFGGRPRRADMQLVGGVKGSEVLTFDQIARLAHNFLQDKLKDVPKAPFESLSNVLQLMSHIVRLHPDAV